MAIYKRFSTPETAFSQAFLQILKDWEVQLENFEGEYSPYFFTFSGDLQLQGQRFHVVGKKELHTVTGNFMPKNGRYHERLSLSTTNKLNLEVLILRKGSTTLLKQLYLSLNYKCYLKKKDFYLYFNEEKEESQLLALLDLPFLWEFRADKENIVLKLNNASDAKILAQVSNLLLSAKAHPQKNP